MKKVSIETEKIFLKGKQHRLVTKVETIDDELMDLARSIYVGAVIEEEDFKRSVNTIKNNIKEYENNEKMRKEWKGAEKIDL